MYFSGYAPMRDERNCPPITTTTYGPNSPSDSDGEPSAARPSAPAVAPPGRGVHPIGAASYAAGGAALTGKGAGAGAGAAAASGLWLIHI